MKKKIKCGARTQRKTFSGAHICGLEKGHTGQHKCTLMLDPSFPLSNPIGKTKKCNFKWGKIKTKK